MTNSNFMRKDTPEIFGNFIEKIDCHEYLEINFLPTTLSIQERWRNNDLSANFLADYWSSFFSAKDEASKQKKDDIKDSINYIFNELLENAMKYAYVNSEDSIRIGLYLYGNDMRFYATNSVNPETLPQFKNLIHQLITNDSHELYINRLESDEDGSCLGFLTIINDYNAKIAWKFDYVQQDPKIINVTIMVRLVGG